MHGADVCMECWLLPCGVSAQIRERTPLVAEMKQMEIMHAAAVRIQRWWKARLVIRHLASLGRERAARAEAGGDPMESTLEAGQHLQVGIPLTSA